MYSRMLTGTPRLLQNGAPQVGPGFESLGFLATVRPKRVAVTTRTEVRLMKSMFVSVDVGRVLICVLLIADRCPW